MSALRNVPNDCDDGDAAIFPGATELCDGVDQDCDGDPEGESCGIWTLHQDETIWESWPLGGDVHAPTAAIEEAFAVEETGRVWVLTRSTWHLLLLEDLSWIDSGDRDSLFPEVAGLPIQSAASVPAGWANTEPDTTADVYLVTGSDAYIYGYDLETRAFTLTLEATFDWSADRLAPDPESVNLAWLAVDETAGWATPGDPFATCGAGEHFLGPYVAYLTTDRQVYLWDAGWCSQFVASLAAADFSVFTYGGAPDPIDLGGADWTGDTLITFRQ